MYGWLHWKERQCSVTANQRKSSVMIIVVGWLCHVFSYVMRFLLFVQVSSIGILDEEQESQLEIIEDFSSRLWIMRFREICVHRVDVGPRPPFWGAHNPISKII
jgi:hypothetical protein